MNKDSARRIDLAVAAVVMAFAAASTVHTGPQLWVFDEDVIETAPPAGVAEPPRLAANGIEPVAGAK